MEMGRADFISKGITFLKDLKAVTKSFFRNRRHIWTHKNRKYVCPRHMAGFIYVGDVIATPQVTGE